VETSHYPLIRAVDLTDGQGCALSNKCGDTHCFHCGPCHFSLACVGQLVEQGARPTFTKGKLVNKSQLIDTLAARYEGNRKAAAHALESVLDTITREVAKGEKVAITGFGSFEKKVRDARWVRNPSTGQRIKAKKKAVPSFKPGAQLKDVVSGAKKLPAITLAAVEKAAPAAAKPAVARTAAAAKKAAGVATTKKTSAAKKSTAKKSTAKKAPAKKAAAKKAPAKKAAAKKTSAAKKSTAKKTTAKKAPAKKTSAAKKSTAKKSTAKKAPAKKTSAAKKSTAKKSTAKKAPAKKTAAKKAPAKKAAKKS
jgi:DNA-binding protein HU-beta